MCNFPYFQSLETRFGRLLMKRKGNGTDMRWLPCYLVKQIRYMTNHNQYKEKCLHWAKELQFLSQSALAYCKDSFDIERFERIRDISAEIISLYSGLPFQEVKGLFCNETGFQTPKLDTRAAIFKEGKILLVHENNGIWSLPGGWGDVLETVRSNTIKEVKEEAGFDVEARRIIAVQDRSRHNLPLYAYNVCKIFVLCDIMGGIFTQNKETTESNFFSLDELPELVQEKVTEAQIKLCFDAYENPDWQVTFD